VTAPWPAEKGGAALRVLLVTGSYPPMSCGVGDYTRALAEALAAEPGVEVGVLTSEPAAAAPAGLATLFPVVRAWRWGDRTRIKEVLARWRPDLVHLQYPTQGYLGDLAWLLPLLMRLGGDKVVQTWHEVGAARLGGFTSRSVPTLPEKLRQAVAQLALTLAGGEIVVVRPDFERRMPGWYRAAGIGRRLRLIPNASVIPPVELGRDERAAERERLGAAGKTLLVFFGFLQEQKGLDDLLAILDPLAHHLVLVGAADESDPYQRDLLRRLGEPPFAGCVSRAGFLEAAQAARVMAAADAVVLPYRGGAGTWNTTLKAAALQGTFVLTTAVDRHGYQAEENVYYARCGDRADLGEALRRYAGRRAAALPADRARQAWGQIARAHLEVYERALGPRAVRPP
jgi:glycosyltransferase involved in cell wall biosynthesis